MIITRGYGPCQSTGTSSGYIELESGWQLIAIPIKYGYWSSVQHKHVHDGVTLAKFENYVLDQLDDKYGSDIVEVANTFTGDAQMFYSYVVGVTPTDSIHNFKLMYTDTPGDEVTGFWIKIIGGNSPYTISWGDVI